MVMTACGLMTAGMKLLACSRTHYKANSRADFIYSSARPLSLPFLFRRRRGPGLARSLQPHHSRSDGAAAAISDKHSERASVRVRSLERLRAGWLADNLAAQFF